MENLSSEFIASISELSKLVLTRSPLDDSLQRVTELTASALPRVDGVGLTLVNDGGSSRPEHGGTVAHVSGRADGPGAVRTAAYSATWVLELDADQYSTGEGPCLSAIGDGKIHRTAGGIDPTFPEYSRLATEHGMGSNVGIPMIVEDRVIGALNLYARSHDAFDEPTIALGAAFADHVAVTVANIELLNAATDLARNLETAMASRAAIEQAKGILMAEQNCDETAAFEILKHASQEHNIKLREVAAKLVATTSAQKN